MIDEPAETPPVRVLVFDARSAFVAFHRNLIPDMGQVDCLYAGRPTRSITLVTEVTRFRLHDLPRSFRSGFALYFLESYKRFLPPYWLQSGIRHSLSWGPGVDARVHLNRSMKVALSSGTVLGAAELFPPIPVRELLRQLRAQSDHASFARLAQFRSQGWSVFEFLAGPEAPPDRLGKFRSFLSDLKATGSQEAAFERHFGHGFEALLEDWRAWVLEQSLGNDPIPPREIRAAILERVVPTIRDRSKKAQDRIQAMRALGSAGYAVGADTLIDVLEEGDERFIPTTTWALESISGLTLGNDANRWAEWWFGRDPDAVREFD